MLGLTTRYLEAAKGGLMRRGRDALQLDLAYPDSLLNLNASKRSQGVQAGDRAPDAPITGAAGQAMRLFNLFRRNHWTLLGYEVERSALLRPRSGLRIHTAGPGGDVVDMGDHLKNAYALSAGDWVLVRPDGYVGAMVWAEEISLLEPYLESVGLTV